MFGKMKFLFIIVALTLVLFDYASSQNYDSLPTVEVIISENPPKKTARITECSCPAETLKEVHNLEQAANNKMQEAPELLYCIFSRPANDHNNTKCEDEVEPVFLPFFDKNHNLVNCGPLENHHLYSFGFYRCGDRKNLEEFNNEEVRENPKEKFTGTQTVLELYQVCYDASTYTTVWTSHKMTDPVVFKTFQAQNDEEPIHEQISIDEFLFKKGIFEQMKKIYDWESTKYPFSKYKLQPEPLVPAEHFVFRIWKRATNHFINMAPLMEFLVPLMDAINDGLKLAQMRLFTLNPMSHTTLKFYTRAIGVNPVQATESKGASSRQLLEHNIWHKFVYDETEKKGLLIYIHNTPRNRPVVKKCDVPQLCEFDEWSDDPQTIDFIPNDWKKFAYCCSVTKEQIREIFFFDVEIEGVLNLNSLITRGGKRKRRKISELETNPRDVRVVKGLENNEEHTRNETPGGERKKLNVSELLPIDTAVDNSKNKEDNATKSVAKIDLNSTPKAEE